VVDHRPESETVAIRGGRVVTATDDYEAEVFVDGDRISLIGIDIAREADIEIDATGKLVIPGCVDPHTHLDSHYEGLTTCDDFTSGTVAAACGGTTCIVDFCIQYRGETLFEALETWREKLKTSPPVIDVGFHMVVSDLTVPNAAAELKGLCEQGITSFKLFLAYKESIQVDDETMFRTMLAAAHHGALVLVHAENGDAIDVLVRNALADGHKEMRWHAITRPRLAEAEATNRALHLGHIAGAPVYIVHISCREALMTLASARERGWRAWGETCTQYLFLDESALDAPPREGAKYVFTPPPRGARDRAHLWRALETRLLSVVSSDHTPYRLADKTAGDDFANVPQGAPGIEERLLMLYDAAVATGRVSMSRLVEIVSTNPAKLFGLYPRKGTLAIGSDADIVVFDPKRRRRLSASSHHSRVDYSLYEGREVAGAPDVVIARGRIVVRDGEPVSEPGCGQFVARHRFPANLALP
jgi:dihydropyrimidinase